MSTYLGEAGPPLALEKLGAGERRDTVSGATLRGDWRSREPDMPISTPDREDDTQLGTDGYVWILQDTHTRTFTHT